MSELLMGRTGVGIRGGQASVSGWGTQGGTQGAAQGAAQGGAQAQRGAASEVGSFHVDSSRSSTRVAVIPSVICFSNLSSLALCNQLCSCSRGA